MRDSIDAQARLLVRPRLESFEGRNVPATGFVPVPDNAVAISAVNGGLPQVEIVDPVSGQTVDQVQAYDNAFRGGVRVALGDVNGDGVKDVVLAPGVGGGPRVKVLDGKTGDQLADFFVYDPSFTGGLYVAAGDVNGDGHADIITGTGVGGGPRIRVLDGATLGRTVLEDFFAYDNAFRGGVLVASGDLNGDGKAEIIAGTGPGGGPQVLAFSGEGGHTLQSFFAYDGSFRGGVLVAAGDLNGDGKAEIIAGTGPGGGPVVRAFREDGQELFSKVVGDPSYRGGVEVGADDVNHNGRDEIIGGVRNGNRVDVHVIDGEHGTDLGSVSGQVDDNPSAGSSTDSSPSSGAGTVPGSTSVEGTITAVDTTAGTVTLKKENGSTVVVQAGKSTTIERNGSHATLADFQVGDRGETTIDPNGIALYLEAKTA